MRSLQQRLAVGLGVGFGLLVAVTGVVLHGYVAGTMWDGVDAGLESEARRLAASVHLDVVPEERAAFTRLGVEVLRELDTEGGAAEARRASLRAQAERSIRLAVAHRPLDEPTAGATHLHEIRDGAGVVVARSRAQGDRALSAAAGAVRLPDGGRGRAVLLELADVSFANPTWQPSWTALRERLAMPPVTATVVVAVDTEAQHALLGRLQSALWIGGVLAVVLAVALAVVTTRKTLAPLRRLRREVAQLDVTRLGSGVRLDERPAAELVPIADALNEALRGLAAAFEREKRMTEDLAHELRTPVAELKSITDVAREWPDDAALQARCMAQCHGIAERMARLVSVLLRVARARTAEHAAQATALDVRERLVAAWGLLESTAAARNQQLEIDAAAEVSVESDPDVVDAILANLLQNAIEHAPEGSRIEGRIETTAAGTTLTLSNPAGDLTPDEAAHAAEPFWQADASRTSSRQGGLGLSLVAELARAAELDFGVGVEDGQFRARLAFA